MVTPKTPVEVDLMANAQAISSEVDIKPKNILNEVVDINFINNESTANSPLALWGASNAKTFYKNRPQEVLPPKQLNGFKWTTR